MDSRSLLAGKFDIKEKIAMGTRWSLCKLRHMFDPPQFNIREDKVRVLVQKL